MGRSSVRAAASSWCRSSSFIPGITPAEAAGTSLAVVFFNGLSGTASYIRQGRVDFRTGVIFAIATIPGSIIGAYLSDRFASRAFYISFGLLLITIAIFLNIRPDPGARWRSRRRRQVACCRRCRSGRVRRSLVDRGGERFAYEFHMVGGIVLSFSSASFRASSVSAAAQSTCRGWSSSFTSPPTSLRRPLPSFFTISAFAGAVSHISRRQHPLDTDDRADDWRDSGGAFGRTIGAARPWGVAPARPVSLRCGRRNTIGVQDMMRPHQPLPLPLPIERERGACVLKGIVCTWC